MRIKITNKIIILLAFVLISSVAFLHNAKAQRKYRDMYEGNYASKRYIDENLDQKFKAIFKKYGWSFAEKEKFIITDSYYRELDEKKIIKLSKQIGLSGNINRDNSVIYVAQKMLFQKGYQEPYYIFFNVIVSREARETPLAAFIELDCYELNILAPASTKEKNVTETMKKYFESNFAKATNKTAERDFPGGKSVSPEDNVIFAHYFRQHGFDVDFKFYRMLNNYFEDYSEEIQELTKKIYPEAMPYMFGYGSNYSEHYFSVKGGKKEFAIDFVIQQSQDLRTKNQSSKNVIGIIVVKPLFVNSRNRFDMFFYPPETSIEQIYADMEEYFK